MIFIVLALFLVVLLLLASINELVTGEQLSSLLLLGITILLWPFAIMLAISNDRKRNLNEQ